MQAHNKFKVFVGAPEADGALGALGAAIERFVADTGVAPKSIGAEFIERSGQLLVSLGYRDDEPAVPVRLLSVHIGNVRGAASDLTSLETSMARAAAAQQGIICHELFITKDDDLFMIFMTAAG